MNERENQTKLKLNVYLIHNIEALNFCVETLSIQLNTLFFSLPKSGGINLKPTAKRWSGWCLKGLQRSITGELNP